MTFLDHSLELDVNLYSNTYSFTFYGTIEDNFYSFEVLGHLNNQKIFIDPSDDLKPFFKKMIAEVMPKLEPHKDIVFE